MVYIYTLSFVVTKPDTCNFVEPSLALGEDGPGGNSDSDLLFPDSNSIRRHEERRITETFFEFLFSYDHVSLNGCWCWTRPKSAVPVEIPFFIPPQPSPHQTTHLSCSIYRSPVFLPSNPFSKNHGTSWVCARSSNRITAYLCLLSSGTRKNIYPDKIMDRVSGASFAFNSQIFLKSDNDSDYMHADRSPQGSASTW